VLTRYLQKRKRHWAGRAVSQYLFVSSWGNRLDIGSVHRAFYAASRRIGLRGARDSHGPRLHDMFLLQQLWSTGTAPRRIQSGACRF
jgi:integrase/recombinase XerD